MMILFNNNGLLGGFWSRPRRDKIYLIVIQSLSPGEFDLTQARYIIKGNIIFSVVSQFDKYNIANASLRLSAGIGRFLMVPFVLCDTALNLHLSQIV